jgi:hypothetical protein
LYQLLALSTVHLCALIPDIKRKVMVTTKANFFIALF